MLTPELTNQIIELINREVVPATGCTEPVAVALCTARACELLGTRPVGVDVSLSANILKNAMGVGIPGTGMTGLPIAIALAMVVGRSDYQLEVLRDVCPEAVDEARKIVDSGIININYDPEAPDKLYVAVKVADNEGNTASATICGNHTHFIWLERNGEVLLDAQDACQNCEEASADPTLTLRNVWEFATETPIDQLEFIARTEELNTAAAEEALNGRYGHSVGRLLRGERELQMMGDTPFRRILSYTSAACDARMGGACMPVMSNSGSGNQGIAATLPVVTYARECGADREHTIRALALSHLTVIYIKQSLGRLSALCGCVVAATGSGCGITYLMGGDYQHVSATVKNMIGNLTGMICDGAKAGCALKLATGVSTAIISSMIAMEGECVDSLEGIIDDDVDRCISNFASIGHDAMNETDRQILGIMTSKAKH